MGTIAEDRAMAVLNRHITTAVEQLTPRPQLERGLVGSMACDDPDDDGPLGRVFVEAHYWLRGVSPEDNRAIFDMLYACWTRHGYVVLSDQRDRPPAPHLKVRHAEDGFSVSLRENLNGQLRISGSSPCIWPDDSSADESS